MAWTITSATQTEHGGLLANLLSLYLHDLSSYFAGIAVLPEGRFRYDYPWEDPANEPGRWYVAGANYLAATPWHLGCAHRASERARAFLLAEGHQSPRR